MIHHCRLKDGITVTRRTVSASSGKYVFYIYVCVYVCSQEAFYTGTKNDNFFRQYDALTYHKPKCKQAKEDARLKSEKAEKSKVEGESKNEIKTEDTDSDAAREVAHTLLEMKNEPNQ